MKYIVEVNAKWLVSIEAENAYQAEHKVLDLDGIWGALVFDKDMIKTDTFAGAVQFCEMTNLEMIVEYSRAYRLGWKQVADAKDNELSASLEVDRLKGLLNDAIAEYNKTVEDRKHAEFAAKDITEHLGRQPE